MNDCTSLIPRSTLTQMVEAWDASCADVREGYRLLARAEERLRGTFSQNSYRFDLGREQYRDKRYSDPEGVIKEVQKDVWASLVERMQLRRLLSVKRCKEMDEQIAKGVGMPDITVTSLLAMVEGTYNQVNAFVEEAVREVFEFLRPPRSQYKTNSEFEVGERVVIRCALSQAYSSEHPFRISYWGHRSDELRALDNVFHALDGKGHVPSHNGPLCDAIAACGPDGKGQTEYFEIRCFKNGNLHVKFRRMDLVATLNQVAGGNRLRRPTEAA